MVTPATKLPTTYRALLQIDAQTLLHRIKNETPYPLSERVRPFLYDVAVETATGLLSSLFHFYMAVFKKCQWHQVITPTCDDPTLVLLNEKTITAAKEKDLIIEDEVPTLSRFPNLHHKVSAWASSLGMNNVQFYIDFDPSYHPPYDRTHPSFVIIPIYKFQNRSPEEIDYLIARRIVLLKIGYGFRTPFYHNLAHWGMLIVNIGIIALKVRRMISLWQAIAATYLVDFACSQVDGWLLRKKIRTADQLTLQLLQTNQGMVSYFHKKLARNFSIQHGSFENYQEFYTESTETDHHERKSELTPFGDEKYGSTKDPDTERLALALNFKPTQT